MKKAPLIILSIILLILLVQVCMSISMVDTHAPRFELFRTKNIYNLLLLDSRTGALWQVQYDTGSKKNEGDIQISPNVLYEESGWNGRFTLTSTENIWTFLLTDAKTGAMWHCQFTVGKKDYRGCYPIVASKV